MIREDRFYIQCIVSILMILVLLLDLSGAFLSYIGTTIILLLYTFGYLVCYDHIPKYAFGFIGGCAVGLCIVVSRLI